MHEYKFHIIYKTTNLLNGKIYVGLHSTDNLNDRYMGSGWVLKYAIKKYGRKNFKREILLVLSDREEAREVEALLVDKEFIARPNTYNLQEGGMGVENQWGENNPAYGKVAHNAKGVLAEHLDGRRLKFDSIQDCAEALGFARANIRNLLYKGIRGRRGWKISYC